MTHVRQPAAMLRTPHLLLLAGLAVLVGCGGSGPVDVQTAERVPLRLEKSDPDRLIRSVLGGYTSAEGADPFEAGLVSREDGDLFLHPQKLPASLRQALADADGDGAIGEDEWTGWVEATYYQARDLPPTTDALRQTAGYEDGPGWFVVEVDGVMTAARRTIYVPERALRSGLAEAAAGGEVRYPDGTWIIGEHRLEGDLVETTAKRRRADGFWDFAVYGPDGALAPATQTEPRPLRTPTQCTGCHLGQKLYEPEKSWPAEAPDGPFGPRTYHVPASWRNAEVAARFQEHARRDDGVLGIYATLFVSRLLADRPSGSLAPEDAGLLERLGL